MTLQQLAQIGEFLGGLSVLLTMIYLAIQVRGNTRALRLSAAQQTHDTLGEGYLELAKDPQLNRLFRVGNMDGLGALNEDESGQFFAMWSYALYVTQNWLYQMQAGSLEKSLGGSWMKGISSNFHSPGFQEYWAAREYVFSEELQVYVNDIITSGPERPWASLGVPVEQS